jgi:hypothetical protein
VGSLRHLSLSQSAGKHCTNSQLDYQLGQSHPSESFSDSAILFSEISKCESNDHDLEIYFRRDGTSHVKTLKFSKFPKSAAQFLEQFQRYYGRYLYAESYQKAQQEKQANSEPHS